MNSAASIASSAPRTAARYCASTSSDAVRAGSFINVPTQAGRPRCCPSLMHQPPSMVRIEPVTNREAGSQR